MFGITIAGRRLVEITFDFPWVVLPDKSYYLIFLIFFVRRVNLELFVVGVTGSLIYGEQVI